MSSFSGPLPTSTPQRHRDATSAERAGDRKLAAALVAMLSSMTMATSRADAPAGAELKFQPRLYELTTETIMPHLEENLRYTITHAQRCVHADDLRRLFPVLEHPALQGCSLQDDRRAPESISYTLVCTAPDTQGHASWQLGEQHLRGTLEVRLGGKNMTFSQRIHARALGPCSEQRALSHAP